MSVAAVTGVAPVVAGAGSHRGCVPASSAHHKLCNTAQASRRRGNAAAAASCHNDRVFSGKVKDNVLKVGGGNTANSRPGQMQALQSIPTWLPARFTTRLVAVTLLSAVVAMAGTGAAAFASSSSGNGRSPKNVLGGELGICSTSPMTGYFREGRCTTGPTDFGTHTVCARVTDEFLQYTLREGNDLVTPRPEYQFPGLKEGDGWCLCASRWAEAMRAGVAPPVVLGATHAKTLEYVGMADLERHAAPPGGGSSSSSQ